MSAQYINYGSLDSWAATIDKRNIALLNKLQQIQQLIRSLEGEWESNSANEIRSKIQGMTPRFQDYYNVIENYAKLLRNIASAYKAAENTNTSNSSMFP